MQRAVLGVYVSPEALEGVLLRQGDTHVEVVERIVRRFDEQPEPEPAAAQSVAAGFDSDDGDFTLEVGGGGGEEFDMGGIDVAGFDDELSLGDGIGSSSSDTQTQQPFGAHLMALLHRCKTLGFPHPKVIFCAAPADVAYVELGLPDGDTDTAPALSPSDRKQLLKQLPDHHAGPVQPDQVAFLPMRPLRQRRRSLAVVAEQGERVAATLRALRERETEVGEDTTVLDAEVSLFAALVEHGLQPSDHERTALVRVGTDDTLVLFFEGGHLLHLERLHSLTTYDPPDTVCSRVLLQQDEKRVGELDSVYVLAANRSERLLEVFRAYYDDSQVEHLRQALIASGLRVGHQDEAFMKASALPAILAGLRVLRGWEDDPPVNLLPEALRRPPRTAPFAWHTIAAAVLLVLLLGAGFWRYQAKAGEIEAIQQEHRQNPVPIPPTSPEVLQARIDSLDARHTSYTQALATLDSLLVGSDTWTSTMEHLSQATAAEPSTWVDAFQTEADTSAYLRGHALSRLAIVDLTRRLEGSIQQLTYQDIGERRVYSYEMTMPLPNELPRAAVYLRETESSDAVDTVVHPGDHSHE